MSSAREIAEGLTSSQAEAIATAFQRPKSPYREVWPHFAQAVLTMPLGIIDIKDNVPVLTPFGLEVRSILQEKHP